MEHATRDWPGAVWAPDNPLAWNAVLAAPRRRLIDLRNAFAHVQNSTACVREKLLGTGDGAWYACDTPALRARTGCVVVAAGIGARDGFETRMARTHPRCNVTMLDPTPWVKRKYTLHPVRQRNLKFLPVGLAPSTGEMVLERTPYNPRVERVVGRTLDSIAPRGATLLKMDIEGSEWPLFGASNASEAAKTSVWLDEGRWSMEPLLHGSRPPEQLMFELHDGTPAAWRGLLRMLYRRGYTLWRAANPRFGGEECGRGCRMPGMAQSLRALVELYFIRT